MGEVDILEVLSSCNESSFLDLRFNLEMKSAQLDSTRERLAELEQQLTKRDETITHQKRMLKTVKEEHKEQFNVSCVILTIERDF